MYLVVTVISAAALFMFIQIAINHVNGSSNSATATINHDLNFNVHYINNNMFDENPIPSNFNFLMSFTDHILINDRFGLSINQASNIYYDFTTYKRLVVTAADSGLTVFEQSTVLDEGSGHDYGTHIQISNTGNFLDENAGFAISPTNYFSWYEQFTNYHQHQMIIGNPADLGEDRKFYAEIHIDFLYNIFLPEFNHRESSTRGIIIPLSNEVYNITTSGEPSREINVSQSGNESILSGITSVVVFAIGSLTCLSALIWSFVMFIKNDDGNGKLKKKQIIKKHSANLIAIDRPVDLSNKSTATVKDFREMVKLSTWLNKPIIYTDARDTDFVLVTEDLTYIYNTDQAELETIEPAPNFEEIIEAEDYEETPVQLIEFEEHLKKKRDNKPNQSAPLWMQRVDNTPRVDIPKIDTPRIDVPMVEEEEVFEDFEDNTQNHWNAGNSGNVARTRRSRFGYSKLI